MRTCRVESQSAAVVQIHKIPVDGVRHGGVQVLVPVPGFEGIGFSVPGHGRIFAVIMPASRAIRAL